MRGAHGNIYREATTSSGNISREATTARGNIFDEATRTLQSQKDSFSLTNVVPQMQRHNAPSDSYRGPEVSLSLPDNAPIWAKLEDECLEAARRLTHPWPRR